MTRGNQRDLAREKAAKKAAGGKSSKEHKGNEGLSMEARKQRDAEQMRLKQQLAAAKKEAEGK